MIFSSFYISLCNIPCYINAGLQHIYSRICSMFYYSENEISGLDKYTSWSIRFPWNYNWCIIIHTLRIFSFLVFEKYMNEWFLWNCLKIWGQHCGCFGTMGKNVIWCKKISSWRGHLEECDFQIGTLCFTMIKKKMMKAWTKLEQEEAALVEWKEVNKSRKCFIFSVLVWGHSQNWQENGYKMRDLVLIEIKLTQYLAMNFLYFSSFSEEWFFPTIKW